MARRPHLRRFVRPVTGALVLGGAIIGIGSLIVPPSASAAGALLSIVIGNDAAHPVPVTGNVKVTNDAAQPVPVNGTVNIGNLPATPAAPTPFEARNDTTLVDGQANGSAFITIPAGQQLTAEFLSVEVLLPPGQVPSAAFNAADGAPGGFIPLIAQGVVDTPFGPMARFTAAVPILDFQTGTFVVSLSRDLPGSFQFPGRADLFAYVSGHLRPTGA